MVGMTLFDDSREGARGKATVLFVILISLNLIVWAVAALLFHGQPLLLGTALLAYSFGLRHAFDVDHIAAIDNVTRKLMQDGKRPLSAGFFFSLGHSTVVFALTLLIAFAVGAAQKSFSILRDVGGLVGTLVSASFLIVIAMVNLFVLASVWRHYRRGGAAHDFPIPPMLRKLLRFMGRSWHMYPLGLLFGLGFDTASEIGLLGLSAAEAARGLPLWTVLIFPALFASAMSLMDTIDGVVMLGAYGWAFVEPRRKLFYNLTLTAISVIVALTVGGIEVAKLLAERFRFTGLLWNSAINLGDNFSLLGVGTCAIFVASWLVSMAVWRLKARESMT